MLSDLSVRRPVLATVFSLLIVVFGAIAFTTLPLRELPDVDRPVVGIDVSYRGASSAVVETQITRIIEDQLSGIEGVDQITATSRDGRASINVEFQLGRDLEAAANDVRNAVARAQSRLPPDADPPVVQKTDADAEPIMFINLSSKTIDRIALTDYADRVVADRIAIIDGVANVRPAGWLRPALRVWLDADALAARGLTADDIEQSLRAQNIEPPAGSVQGVTRDYSMRIERPFESPEQFARLPIGRGAQGGVVRLGDVARIKLAPEETRSVFRGNGEDQIGMGIVRQSKSNALEVADRVRAEVEAIRPTLPPGVDIVVTFDSTRFIAAAIGKVWRTMAEALILVVLVIFLFLGSLRAAAIPAVVIPVCLIGSFALMAAFGFSINLLTLLALVLAIGLVVDDSIIVLENVQRRVDEHGEPPTVAAIRGTRQVFFAVVATSAVLVAVFTPMLFVGGFVGRLFIELAVTIAGLIVISAFCALSLTPMMCSKLVRPVGEGPWLNRKIDAALTALRASYRASLEAALNAKWIVFLVFAFVAVGGFLVLRSLPSELSPPEDRGGVFLNMQAPEGAGFEYSARVMNEADKILNSYVETGEATRANVILPGFGDSGTGRFNSGIGRLFLTPWDERERSGQEILAELNRRLGEIPGAIFRVSMENPFQGRGGGGDASIVLGGTDYEELAAVAQRVIDRARTEAPGLIRPRMNYEPNSPRVLIDVDRERAAALGVSVAAIGRTLEATMGQRRVNSLTRDGEEYFIFLQAERPARTEIADLTNKFVRSDRTGDLIPLASVVTFRTVGDSAERRRLDRQAAVTIAANLAPGYSIGTALAWLEKAAIEEMAGANMSLNYTGASKQYRESTSAILFAFGLALVIVFLVLAAQFESFIHPLVIMLTVPLAIAGGVIGTYLLGGSLNVYSQIGLIILIALAAKNGILIVEFANQLRDQGMAIREAILEASDLRLRPILMTSIATVIGAVPLMLAEGPGAESRMAIGVVIVFGVSVATLLTLFVAPTLYDLLARFTRTPEAVARDVEAFEAKETAAQPAE
jgi:multidrug efflux pump